MEERQVNRVTRVVICVSIVLFAISFWFGKIAALTLLFAAITGISGVFALSFKHHKVLDAKLFYLILFLLFVGRGFFVFGNPQVAGYFYLSVVVVGAILILRGVFFLNKYCCSDAESKFDEL